MSLAGDAARTSPSTTLLPGVPFTVVVDTTPCRPRDAGRPARHPRPHQSTCSSGSTATAGRPSARGVTEHPPATPRSRSSRPLTGDVVLRARQEGLDPGTVTRSAGSRPCRRTSAPTSFPSCRRVLPRDAGGRSAGPAQGPAAADRQPDVGLGQLGVGLRLGVRGGLRLGALPRHRLGGHWVDTSDGTGQAVPFNGGLVAAEQARAHRGR